MSFSSVCDAFVPHSVEEHLQATRPLACSAKGSAPHVNIIDSSLSECMLNSNLLLQQLNAMEGYLLKATNSKTIVDELFWLLL